MNTYLIILICRKDYLVSSHLFSIIAIIWTYFLLVPKLPLGNANLIEAPASRESL